MKFVNMLFFLTLLNTFAIGQETKKITITGHVFDQKSKMPLAAKIKVIYADSELNINESSCKNDGSFEVNILPKTLIFQAKSANYIVSNVAMNLENIDTQNIVCEIPLLFESRTKNNLLYSQYASQKKSIDSISIKNSPKNMQVFQVIDAFDSQAMPAQIRLLASDKTQLGASQTSSLSPFFEFSFTQKDNIFVEVTANGYQKFLSNILIKDFDHIVHENTAKLIKKVSFLNIFIKNEGNLTKIEVLDLSNLKPIVLSKKGGIQVGSLSFEGHYKATVFQKNASPIIKEFDANEGLNQLLFNLENDKKLEEIIHKTAIVESKPQEVEKQTFISEKKAVNLETQTVFFDQSSAILSKNSKEILENISKKMLDSPNINIEITGHTDNIGDTRQNLYLSEFRAKVICNFLFNKGIKMDRISLKGNGSKEPNTTNDTEENRQKNRRAELRFY